MRRAGLVIALCLAGHAALAQEPKPLAVGDDAPDFTLPAAMADGIQAKPVRLRDLRDQTVVIAFFYKARTKG
jgi:peroxiredoxin